MRFIDAARNMGQFVVAATGYDIAVELVRLIPTILWIALLVYIVHRFYEPIRDKLLPNINSVKIAGIEVGIARMQIDQAVENSTVATHVSEDDRNQVLVRAQAVAAYLKGAHVLWVDDHPVNNVHAKRALNSFGIFVDIALSTEMALEMLERMEYDYDVVVSDMSRDGKPQEGTRLAQLLYEREKRISTRPGSRNTVIDTIIYAGNYDRSRGTPPYVFAMTNRPDELFNYVMDVLERVRALVGDSDAAAGMGTDMVTG